MNNAIAHLLRGGVLLSIGIVILGLTFTFVHHPQYVTSKTDLGQLTTRRTRERVHVHELVVPGLA